MSDTPVTPISERIRQALDAARSRMKRDFTPRLYDETMALTVLDPDTSPSIALAHHALREAAAEIDRQAQVIAERDATIAELRERVHVATDACNANLQALGRAEATIAELERSLDQVLVERDEFQEWADGLAYAIAPAEEIGEHSSGNNPWAAAIEALAGQRQATERTIAELRARTTPPEGWNLDGIEDTLHSLRVDCRDALADLIEHAYLPSASPEETQP